MWPSYVRLSPLFNPGSLRHNPADAAWELGFAVRSCTQQCLPVPMHISPTAPSAFTAAAAAAGRPKFAVLFHGRAAHTSSDARGILRPLQKHAGMEDEGETAFTLVVTREKAAADVGAVAGNKHVAERVVNHLVVLFGLTDRNRCVCVLRVCAFCAFCPESVRRRVVVRSGASSPLAYFEWSSLPLSALVLSALVLRGVRGDSALIAALCRAAPPPRSWCVALACIAAMASSPGRSSFWGCARTRSWPPPSVCLATSTRCFVATKSYIYHLQ